MPLGLGLGFVGNEGASSASTPITGLKIMLTNTNNNFVGITDLGITFGESGLDVVDDLANLSQTVVAVVNGFDDLNLDEYGTDSNYDRNDKDWRLNPWNDSGIPTLNTSIHYSNGNSGAAPLIIFAKLSKEITKPFKVKIRNQVSSLYKPTSASFEDQAGNTLTPTNSPDITATEVIWDFA